MTMNMIFIVGNIILDLVIIFGMHNIFFKISNI